MKSDSLFSRISNLSQFSYRSNNGIRDSNPSELFLDSLPFLHDFNQQILPSNFVKQQHIQYETFGLDNFSQQKNGKQINQHMGTCYWTTELKNNIEGTSDMQGHDEMVKQEEYDEGPVPKIQNVEQQDRQADENLDDQFQQQKSYTSQKIGKNETKNIPKNFGKAIIIFFEKNRSLIEKVLEENGTTYGSLLQKLRDLKKKINTIKELRNLWQIYPQSKSIRIISNYFLRKHSLHYIYNSRIKTRLCHAKYKRRLQEAIMNPKEFNHIKNY